MKEKQENANDKKKKVERNIKIEEIGNVENNFKRKISNNYLEKKEAKKSRNERKKNITLKVKE